MKPKKKAFSTLALFPPDSLRGTLRFVRRAVTETLIQKGLPATPREISQWMSKYGNGEIGDNGLKPLADRGADIFDVISSIEELVAADDYESACSMCVGLGAMLEEFRNASRGKQPTKRDTAVQYILEEKQAGRKVSAKEVEAYLESQGFKPAKGMAQTISKWVREYCAGRKS